MFLSGSPLFQGGVGGKNSGGSHDLCVHGSLVKGGAREIGPKRQMQSDNTFAAQVAFIPRHRLGTRILRLSARSPRVGVLNLIGSQGINVNAHCFQFETRNFLVNIYRD